jgi:hypothetical protein
VIAYGVLLSNFWDPAIAWGVGISLVGVVALAISARRARTSTAAGVWMMVIASGVIWLSTGNAAEPDPGFFGTGHTDPTALWVWAVVAVVASLLLGTVATRRGRRLWASAPPWVFALAVVATIPREHQPLAALGFATMAVAWWCLDAWFRRSAVPAAFAAVGAPIVTATLLLSLGLAGVSVGVGLAVGAVILVGVALGLDLGLRPFLFLAATIHLAVALGLTVHSGGAAGIVLTIAGILVITVGLFDNVPSALPTGTVLAIVGSWITLGGFGVQLVEAYVAPVAVLWAVVGVISRRRHGSSSWVADFPAFAWLGGSALMARLYGESGWHAVFAGAVAIVAIAVGSQLRLAGPLLGGSILLALVSINETVRVSAGVPTWFWLATGGLTLLGTGVTMELRGLGPIESGRHLIELIDERYN